MRETTITGHHDTHHPVVEALWIWRSEALWILAGIIVMLAFGDALTLLVLALAIVTMTTAWWTYRKVERRVERNDAELASVTHLRPALTGQRDLKKTSAHAPWRGPSAA